MLCQHTGTQALAGWQISVVLFHLSPAVSHPPPPQGCVILFSAQSNLLEDTCCRDQSTIEAQCTEVRVNASLSKKTHIFYSTPLSAVI